MKHTHLIFWLFSIGVNCSESKHKYQSPVDLHTAANSGDLEMVKKLVAAGHDVNLERSGFGWITTPLMLAIRNGHDNVAIFLIEHPSIKLRLGDDHDPTPFHAAACHGRLKIAKILLKKGGRPKKSENAQGSPVNCAARKGDLEMVKYLLQEKFSPNSLGPGLHSPLQESNNAQITALLIEKGAEIDKKNDFEHTPLMTVLSRGGNFEVVKLLLEAGADPNTEDSVGNTAYMEARQRGAPAETISLLLEYGAKPTKRKYVYQNE